MISVVAGDRASKRSWPRVPTNSSWPDVPMSQKVIWTACSPPTARSPHACGRNRSHWRARRTTRCRRAVSRATVPDRAPSCQVRHHPEPLRLSMSASSAPGRRSMGIPTTSASPARSTTKGSAPSSSSTWMTGTANSCAISAKGQLRAPHVAKRRFFEVHTGPSAPVFGLPTAGRTEASQR